MTGVAIEQMLELWCVELRQVKAHLKALFAHPSVATSAAAFLDGLLGPERRKTGWMRAEAAGDPGPWRQQAVLGRSHWNADALREMVREYALETLASPGAVLVIDETGFLKQGVRSCGSAGNTPDQPARLPAARLACLPPTCRTGAAPLLTVSSTCPRTGPIHLSAGARLRCPRASALSPSRRWQRR